MAYPAKASSPNPCDDIEGGLVCGCLVVLRLTREVGQHVCVDAVDAFARPCVQQPPRAVTERELKILN